MIGDDFKFDDSVAGVLVQYPDTTGSILDYEGVVSSAHSVGALVVAATDLMALTHLTPPGEWGADIEFTGYYWMEFDDGFIIEGGFSGTNCDAELVCG